MTHPNLTPPATSTGTPSSPSPTRQDSASRIDSNSTGTLPVSYSKSSELIGDTRFLKYRPVPSKMQNRLGNSQGFLPSSSTFLPSSEGMDEYPIRSLEYDSQKGVFTYTSRFSSTIRANTKMTLTAPKADAWMRAVEHPTFPSEDDLKVIEGTKEAMVIRKKRALVGVIKDILDKHGVSIQDAIKTYGESSEDNKDDWDWNLYLFAN
ncbi:uncharacterized protein L199_001722 [Kwoniella botswanensis]|uniref:uncharacterized protein n=1 Tax=Kwoniella botswanensis TaxID=1268659 RepID=UPI00315D9DAA